MDSANNARSHHNQENHSDKDFTMFGSIELSLMHLFQESNEETTYNAEHNDTIAVPTNMSYFENSEVKQTSTCKQSAPSEDVEEEPKLKPQDLLIWALKENKFDRFSSLLGVPGVTKTQNMKNKNKKTQLSTALLVLVSCTNSSIFSARYLCIIMHIETYIIVQMYMYCMYS